MSFILAQIIVVALSSETVLKLLARMLELCAFTYTILDMAIIF